MRVALGIITAALCVFLPLQRAANAFETRRELLSDGVRLIMKPEPNTELVAVSICVRTEPDRTPIEDAAGELVARSLFSSSFNRSQERMAAGISQVGGSIETVRTASHVNVTCVALPAQLREAIFLLCEVLKNAEFGGLERVRAQLLAEQQRGGLDVTAGLDILRRELQARPDLADLPFRRVTREQAVAYFHSRYVPERTAIAVVGRFDAEAVHTAFRDALTDFDRPAVRGIRTAPLYSHATNYPTRVLQQAGTSGYALAATPAPSLSDPDYPAFIVLDSVLGEGHASRLFQRLRDAKGIGYNVGSSWQRSLSDPLVSYLQWEARSSGSPSRGVRAAEEPAAGASGPPVQAATGAETPSAPSAAPAALTAENALRLLVAQIDGLVSDPPTDAELRRARSVAVGREALRHERARDRAFLLAWYEAMGAPAGFDDELRARIAAVTREDVMRAARNYLSPRACVLIVPGR